MRPKPFRIIALLFAPVLCLVFLGSALSRAQTVTQLKTTDRGYSVVQVSINGAGPYPFLLDTGANRTLIQNELLNTLKVASGELVPVNMATGVSYLRKTIVSSVAVAGQAVHDLEIEGIDADKLSRLNPTIQGVLGEDFLKHFDILIDNHAKTLTLDEDSNLANSLVGERRPLSFSGSRGGHPTRDRLVFDLKLPSSRESMHFLIDSGANYAMFFPSIPLSFETRVAPQGTLQTVSGNSLCHTEVVALAIGKDEVGPVTLAFCEGLRANNDVDGLRANNDVDGLLPTSIFKRLFISHSGAYVITNPRSQKPSANALAKSLSKSFAKSASGD